MRTLYIGALLIAAAAAADDPIGWSKAKWGMTDDQLLAAFPGQAARLDPPQAGARIHMKPFQLAGEDFHVYFQADKDGLTGVLLTPIGTPAIGFDALFQSLQNLLVEKYGRPWKSTEGDQAEMQWTVQTTVIRLSRSKTLSTLNLHYTRATALDKI